MNELGKLINARDKLNKVYIAEQKRLGAKDEANVTVLNKASSNHEEYMVTGKEQDQAAGVDKPYHTLDKQGNEWLDACRRAMNELDQNIKQMQYG
jgi:hypothetical protein